MRRFSTGLCATIAALCFFLTACAHLPGKHSPTSPIVLRSEVWSNPPMHIFIAEVDLTDPRVSVRVAPGGPDPDGSGPWQTILTQPTQIAAREHFDLVINGDFFESRRVKNPKGTNTLPDPERWGAAQGPAVTDGRIWSTSKTNRPCFIVHKDGSVAIKGITQPGHNDWEVVAGNVLLLRNGSIVSHAADTNRHPRTCVGINAQRSKLVLLVVDGRKAGVSIGMKYDDLAKTLLGLGCSDAVNLDGGGSTIMAVRDAQTGGYRTLNMPSDGHERPVADVLGISMTRVPGQMFSLECKPKPQP